MKAALLRDIEQVDRRFPPEMCGLFLDNRLLGQIYLANGKGPHPTILFLHGFPGYEKNLDLAQMLRRGGCNVLLFHYSGSWGSRGTYSFTQAFADTKRVCAILHEEAFASKFRIDRSRVALAGHSVGGFLALLAAKEGFPFEGFAALAPYNLSFEARRLASGEKEAKEALLSLFSEGMAPLVGATPESLLEEVMENRDPWDLLDVANEVYAEKNVFLAIAEEDQVALPFIHQIPLAEKFKQSGGAMTLLSFPSSHDFPEKRVALCEALYEWLERTLFGSALLRMN